jgi:hypothetical protein
MQDETCSGYGRGHSLRDLDPNRLTLGNRGQVKRRVHARTYVRPSPHAPRPSTSAEIEKMKKSAADSKRDKDRHKRET